MSGMSGEGGVGKKKKKTSSCPSEYCMYHVSSVLQSNSSIISSINSSITV